MQRSNSRQSTGRRNSNRTSNSFKFHNFVFNEANQKFCLEEQHGNKKITVLHWRKEEDENRGMRSCESDSKLVKSDRANHLPTLLSTDDESEESVNETGTSGERSNRVHHRKRLNTGVAASASSPSALLSTSVSDSQNSLPQQCSALSLNLADSCGLPSGSSTTSSLFHSPDRLSQELISKYNLSSSSVTTTSSFRSSSSSAFNWPAHSLNHSLDSLDLNESVHLALNSHRKPNPVSRVVSCEESDSEEDNSDEDNDEFYRRYSSFQQQPRKELNTFCDELQTQPLDLSIKSRRDHNNNANKKDVLVVSESPQIKFRENEVNSAVKNWSHSSLGRLWHNSRDSPRFTSDVCLSDSDLADSARRTESLSPSTLISAIKCCSPQSSSTAHWSEHWPGAQGQALLNPFLLTKESTNQDGSGKLTSSLNNSSTTHHHSSLSKLDLPDVLDSFLEEEISKFLHSNSTIAQRSKTTDDINEKIENKLRLLQQEVLSKRSRNSDNLELFDLDSSKNHLKMHFKLNANKNLEPYGHSETSKIRLNSGSCRDSSTLPRMRVNHRNQIKRHLEDAFKQNGFLIKTKQVSDANNSAMFCKFRQLRKYTRYYLKSWQNQLPDEVNKLWKGFLPPKTERPYFITSTPALTLQNTSSALQDPPL